MSSAQPRIISLRKKILFICGSLNQTTQMHTIAQSLPEFDHYYTPYYVDGAMELLRKRGALEFTIVGGEFYKRTIEYLHDNRVTIDYRGQQHHYDLIVRCGDMFVPKNTRGKRSVLVQEGMTDPKNIRFYLIKYFGILPRWMASTATFGLSDEYDKFCVASSGYRDHFIRNGVNPSKIVVTGIPNFDNCKRFLNNSFAHKDYVLVCTSDMRETYRYENRPKFIKHCLDIAGDKQVIFKLHPNENKERAIAEINTYAPKALVFSSGSAEEMVANCDTLITRYSTVIYTASALGKKIYSDLDADVISALTPQQNGTAATRIAEVCREVLVDDELHSKAKPWKLRKQGLKQDIRVALAPLRKKDLTLSA
jgi:hypothetical protein